jgi:hypothetical protein
MKHPRTLQEAIIFFSDADRALDYMCGLRFPNGVACPTCGRKDVVFLKNQRKWQCKSVHAKRQFSAKVGTIFEDSPIALDKWLVAVWMICNCKNGVSSYEIGRAIGVTQKSAWFMMHRIRLAMKDGSFMKLGGGSATPCEADETFIGGKVKNMHRSRRIRVEAQKTVGLKNETKTIIVGVLDRKKGKIRAEVVSDRKQGTLDMVIRRNVKVGSVVYTDDHVGYDNLRSRFAHESINKQVEGYIKGKVHTQGIENFWSLLKRGIGGTYVAVEPCHLFRYLDEQMFRFNNRKDNMGNTVNDSVRFESAMSQVAGKRLTYAELTGKVGETAF